MAKSSTFNISVKLLTQQFNKGIKDIQRQIRGVGNFIKGAFALGSITAFGKQMIQTAMEFEDAMRAYLKELDGKVWNLYITDEELPAANERYKVSNIARDGEVVIARVIAESPDGPWKRSAARPNLEDLYLYLNGA